MNRKDALRQSVRTRYLDKKTVEDQRGPMGAYPPTGKAMEADYIAIYRVEEGRIVEAWAEWDNLSGLKQLGHYQSA